MLDVWWGIFGHEREHGSARAWECESARVVERSESAKEEARTLGAMVRRAVTIEHGADSLSAPE
jgi:hypothetical protein